MIISVYAALCPAETSAKIYWNVICKVSIVYMVIYVQYVFSKKHIVLHMIGHSLGLWHEHNRPDRDQFVEVRWNEIRAGQSNFFRKIPDNQANSRNIPYDYLSIMHYGKSVSPNNTS